MLLNEQGNPLSARILLDELRAGRLPNALELLEQRIDTCVMAISKFAEGGTESERERAAGTLQVLRNYRARYPRKSEATILEDAESLATLERAREKARRILNGQ
jgi:hypothetical protein